MSSPLDRIDWPAAEAALHERGFAVVGPLLAAAECERLALLWEDEAAFRARIVMERHAFDELGDDGRQPVERLHLVHSHNARVA